MSGHIRSFRRFSVPRLVREAVEYQSEARVLVEIVKELEFRRGKVALVLKATLVRLLAQAEWQRLEERQEDWEHAQSLPRVLRDAEPRLLSGVKLLQAAGYPVFPGLQHRPVDPRGAIRRAIAWNDGGRITKETGEPASLDRCRLLVDVFTRAIALVRADGLARRGAAENLWPMSRKLVLAAMQKQARQRKAA